MTATAAYMVAVGCGILIGFVGLAGVVYLYVGLWHAELTASEECEPDALDPAIIAALSYQTSSADASTPSVTPGGDPLEAAFALDAEYDAADAVRSL